MRYKIFIASVLAFGGSVNALEFGFMGNISAGMGGAGVALKNSQWAIYYNPALLAVNKKSGFAYSFGVGYKETNLSQALSVDYDNLQAMPDKIDGLFNGATTISTRATRATNLNVGGAFGSVLQNLLGTGNTPTDDDLKTYVEGVAKDSGITIDASKGTQEIIQDIQKSENGNTAFETIKKDLQNSIVETQKQNPNADLGLLGSVVENLTPNNIGGLLDAVAGSNGNLDLQTLLTKMGGITLSASSDPALSQFLQDINIINNIINKNDFSIASQNGLVVNIGSKKKRGTISIAVMPSVFASANAKIDSTHNQIIIDTGSGNYEKADLGSGVITLSASNKATYDSSSVLSDDAKHSLNLSSVAVAEVPIGYGHLIETKFGNFAVGGAVKYIFGMGYSLSSEGSFQNVTNGINVSTNDLVQTHTFGLDIGALYSPRVLKNLNVGLVIKNINAPKIKTNTTNVVLNTQFRAGVSYSFINDKIVIAADLDLLPNDTLSVARPKSQVFGGGLLIDLKWVDLRMGAMYDFRNNSDEGMILTAGINILGFLDVAVQSNLHLTSGSAIGGDFKVPSYLYLKVGGGFSW